MIQHALWVTIAAVATMIAQEILPDEQRDLQVALAEAGNSPSELLLVLKRHLKQYPNSPRRPEIEGALVKTAIQQDDDQTLLEFGESVLKRDQDNLQVLEHVTTAFLHQGDKPGAQRALDHARHFAELIDAAYRDDKFTPGGGSAEMKRKDEFDRGRARALLLEARAHGILGHNDDAIRASLASYGIFPSVEAARETSRWLVAAGREQEAIEYLADAFTIGGLHSAEQDGARDRARLGELYRKLHGSEAGLGDLILKAYDTTASQLAARRAELRAFDPNAQLKDPIQFTLTGLEDSKLPLSSLLGKVVVMDFWATWCIPCRDQHPLYEQVKTKFKDSGDVVFLAVDTDEDHSLVKPFLTDMKWNPTVYFDDGLQNLLQVSSIPTTIILGKNGSIFTRMVGFLPDRFVDMLTDRVNEALGKAQVPAAATAPAKSNIHPTIRQ